METVAAFTASLDYTPLLHFSYNTTPLNHNEFYSLKGVTPCVATHFSPVIFSLQYPLP